MEMGAFPSCDPAVPMYQPPGTGVGMGVTLPPGAHLGGAPAGIPSIAPTGGCPGCAALCRGD